MRRTIFSAVGLAFAQHVAAQFIAKQCPSNEVCYQLHIPATTAQSGQGDIFFQISGPTSNSWIGLGEGSQMAGANIFIMYAAGNGNVTVSARLGIGHVEPKHDTSAQITVLEGSGVKDGTMTANVRCSNCASWSGGNTDFNGDSAPFIYAWKEGSSLDSTDPSEDLVMHTSNGDFTWSFAQAKGGNDANPFVSAEANSTSTSGASPAATGAGAASSGSASSDGNDDDDDDDDGGVAETIQTVHGVLASVAFLALFPIGAIIIRVASFSGVLWVHAAIQLLSYVIFTAAFGMGIWMAVMDNELSNHHPIIGIVLFVILFFQPFGGLRHHSQYKKTGGRTLFSHAHIWIGRIAIVLGMVNGGLGLQLAAPVPTKYIIAYAVVAGVMGIVYMVAIIFGEVKRKRTVEHDKELTPAQRSAA